MGFWVAGPCYYLVLHTNAHLASWLLRVVPVLEGLEIDFRGARWCFKLCKLWRGRNGGWSGVGCGEPKVYGCNDVASITHQLLFSVHFSGQSWLCQDQDQRHLHVPVHKRLRREIWPSSRTFTHCRPILSPKMIQSLSIM